MSSTTGQGVFAHIQLRSSTPAPNEKVLNFLEGMAREGDEPTNSPPRSLVDPDEYLSKPESIRNGGNIYSPAPRSKASDTLLNGGPGGMFSPRYDPKMKGLVQEVRGEEDLESNVQDGVRSEIGEMMAREPGPNDPPGPKYASYDSGPSFGNFGPLPADDVPPASQNPYARGSWNPVWPEIVNGEGGGGEQWANGNGTGLTEGGQAAYPAGLTSRGSDRAATPRQTPANIDSPKAEPRPWSPTSNRSRRAPTEKGTVYPPLPESRLDMYPDGPSSPKSRARSKAASISPSDSPTQGVPLFAPKNGTRSPPPASVLSGGHHSRPFSPYRHAPTQEDLLNAAVRGRALVIPQSPEKAPSKAPSVASQSPSKMRSPPQPQSRQLSQMGDAPPKAPSQISKQPSVAGSKASRATRSEREQLERERDLNRTPTPTRPHSPEGLDAEEARIVNDALAARTPRTSYYAASLEPEVTNHYHDMELCVLLQKETDPNQHEVVKKALRKAVRQRIKKLGMKYDHESIKAYRKSHHDHDPSVHLNHNYAAQYSEEPPQWAADLKRELVVMQQRIESLGPKIEGIRSPDRTFAGERRFMYEPDESTRTPMTQTVNIQTGTLADSMYQPRDTELLMEDDENLHFDETDNQSHRRHHTDGETRSLARSASNPQSRYQSEAGHDHSGGEQYLETELFKLRQRQPAPGDTDAMSHRSWEVAQHNEEDEENVNAPTIPDINGDTYGDHERASSPPLPDLPPEANGNRDMTVHPQGPWNTVDYSDGSLAPWQRIHSRLLNWAIIWPMSELENALNSATRGQQVDEVALSIWSTQTYKRYVRARLTDSPQGVVDRLFVPPNMADAINNAVFNGRHGDACGMLKDLWAPFGLEGMPRLLVVLAKHRSDPNHWVVHRFSLPDGSLATYDSYPERTLPDGRPLGWWFAIRVAWPSAKYPSPDNLVQKMVRLHRPLQLAIDNSVAAAGIWRNILMGSRAERSLDLERLRDLINTEVKNLKQRKQMGKLSIGGAKPAWEDMN